MIPAKFGYVRPASLADAVAALAGNGDDAKVIAGGQSLVPLLRLRLANPGLLVDIGKLSELRGVVDEGATLRIGALTSHHELAHDPVIAANCGLIAEAAATPTIAHAWAVRWNFSYRYPQPGPSLGTRIPVRISSAASVVVR